MITNFSSKTLDGVGGFAIGSDGKLYVQAVGFGATIYTFSPDGAELDNIGTFSQSQFIGTNESHLEFGPNGDLYGISNTAIWSYSFDESKFSRVANFGNVTLDSAGGFAVGPDGILYLQADGPGASIYTFDPVTGDQISNLGRFSRFDFIGTNSAHLSFDHSGNLYGMSENTLWKYDFETAEFSGLLDFSNSTFDGPGGIAIQPIPEPSVLGMLSASLTFIWIRRRSAADHSHPSPTG